MDKPPTGISAAGKKDSSGFLSLPRPQASHITTCDIASCAAEGRLSAKHWLGLWRKEPYFKGYYRP